MTDCLPLIGVIVANGSTVEIGYVPIFDSRIPPIELLLETVLAILSWADVSTGEISRSSWTHADCTPRDALHTVGSHIDG